MSENRPEISAEVLSRSVKISREIAEAKVAGEKEGEEAVKADIRAQEILKSKFFPSQYESVEQMISISRNDTVSSDAKRNAEDSLRDLGTALFLSTPKMEGWLATGTIDQNMPESFKGISEVIENNWLVRDEDDEVGKEIVNNLRGLETINRRAAKAPGTFEKKRVEETEKVVGSLFDKLDELDDPDSEDACKLSAVIGYLDGGIKPEVIQPINQERNSRRRDVKPMYDDEGNFTGYEGYESSWQLTADYAAEAMKYMDSGMRWSSYTPPEWFKKMGKNPDGSVNKEGEMIQARIEYMVTVNNAAARLLYAGKDLAKIYENDSAFNFTNEQMTKLFDGDFKLVTSKMLNDLCEFDVDQNGVKCLKYKEKFYKLDKSQDEGFALGPDGKRIVIPDSKSNIENRVGAWSIDEGVMEKIRHIMDYKEEMVKFLAKQNGRPEQPNFMDRMNAYTAYNLVFAMGDTSIWDRMRILPTYGGVISDAIRTLNPEYKALAKWQVLKSGKIKESDALFESEYFSGPMADYILQVMRYERDLGYDKTDESGKVVGHVDKPLDGYKTMRQKIVDGDVSLLASKTFYGFFDFVNGGRDLYQDVEGKKNFYNDITKVGEKVNLGELVMNYASFDESGELISRKGNDFNFGHRTVTFMNEFRDSLEGASLAYNCTMGKVEVKDPAVWARSLKDKMGMVNGIKFNGKNPFSYTNNPNFWRDAMIGSFGFDKRRISSEHICLKKPEVKPGQAEQAYNLYLYDLLVKTFGLSNSDLNINELMRLLGVDVVDREKPYAFVVTIRNDVKERSERLETKRIENQINDNFNKLDKVRNKEGKRDFSSLVSNVSKIKADSYDFIRLKRDFDNAVKTGSYDSAEGLYKEIMRRFSKT